jgi:hypothetical protein
MPGQPANGPTLAARARVSRADPNRSMRSVSGMFVGTPPRDVPYLTGVALRCC